MKTLVEKKKTEKTLNGGNQAVFKFIVTFDEIKLLLWAVVCRAIMTLMKTIGGNVFESTLCKL